MISVECLLPTFDYIMIKVISMQCNFTSIGPPETLSATPHCLLSSTHMAKDLELYVQRDSMTGAHVLYSSRTDPDPVP